MYSSCILYSLSGQINVHIDGLAYTLKKKKTNKENRCLVCLFVFVFICLFVYLFVCLFVCLFVYLSVCLFVCQLVCLSTCLFVCLSVCLFVSFFR